MKIIKRELEVDIDQFIVELHKLSVLYRKNGYVAFAEKTINKEFGLKLTKGDFFKLAEQCEFKIVRDVILFDFIDNRVKQIKNG